MEQQFNDLKETETEYVEIEKHGATFFTGRVILTILAFLKLIIVPVILGPHLYGAYIFLFGFRSFSILIATLNLGDVVSRYVPLYKIQKTEMVGKLTSWSLKIRSLSLLPTTIGYVVFIWVFAQEYVYLLPLLILSIPLASFASLFFATLFGFKKMRIVNFRYILWSVASLIFIIVFFLLLGFLGVVLSITLSDLIIFALGLYYFLKLRKNTRNQDKKIETSEYWKFSIPLYLRTILGSLYYYVALFILSIIFGISEQIGYFGLAMSFMQNVIALRKSLRVALFPHMVEMLANEREKEFQNIINTYTRYSFIITSFITVIFWINGMEIIAFLFGMSYLQVIPLINIVCISLLLGSTLNAFVSIPKVYGKSTPYLFAFLISSILTIGLYIVLIPYFGLLGTFYAILITDFSASLYLWQSSIRLSRKLRTPYGLYTKCGIAIFVPLIIYITINIGLSTVQIALAYSLYLFFLLALRIIEKKDFQKIGNALINLLQGK